MRTFTDATGRVWTVEITTSAVRRVRDSAGLLLTGLLLDEMKMLNELAIDTPKLADVLYAICRDQVGTMTIDQFSDAISGAAIKNALEALAREAIDFFTSPEDGKILNEGMDKLIETQRLMAQASREMIANLNPSQTAKIYSDSVTSSPGSPASTPAPENLANLP